MTGTDLYPIKQDQYSGRLGMVYTAVIPKPGYHYEYSESGIRTEVKNAILQITPDSRFDFIVGGCAGTQYGCKDGRARTKEEYEADRKLTVLPIELPKILIPIPEIIKKIGTEEICGTGIQSFEES